MIKRIITWLFFIVIIGGAALLYYSWYFTKIVITEQAMGPYTLVYEAYTGAYSTVGPVMDKIYNGLIEDAQIKTDKWFGIYYDDPAVVAADQLRSDIGVIVDDQYSSELFRLQGKYNLKTWDKQKALVVEFPYQSPLHIIAGVLKVYPELAKYTIANKIQMHEVMEIYDKTNKKIFYVMPIK